MSSDYTSQTPSNAIMFILFSLFILGLSIIGGWASVVFLAVFFNLPGLIWGIFLASLGVFFTLLSLICLWLALLILKIVLKWLIPLISGLAGLIWGLIRSIFGLICRVFGKHEEKVRWC